MAVGLGDEGGPVDLIFHLPGDTNIGSLPGWRDIARLAALHANPGVEVFPEFE